MRPERRPGRVAALVFAICLVVTAVSTAAAARADSNTEKRLLQVQTKQAAAVLSTAILLIQQPLATALSVQAVAGPAGDPAAFRRLMKASVAPTKTFVSASLWKRTGRTVTRLASVGADSALVPGRPATAAYLRGAFASKTFLVRSVKVGGQGRVEYTLGDPQSGFIVYAERAIPANRRSPVDHDSAFADLHYAIYLGAQKNLGTLSTTDVDPKSLPLDGRTFQATIPFGTTTLILTTSPSRHLGAGLSQSLPWMLLVGGLFIAVFASRSAYQLVRGRKKAEEAAETVAGLYEKVEALYGEQRDLAVRLQRALLPHVLPIIPDLDIAAEYVAGATGVDIGGDWYSIIALGEDKFGFVVGDVSGHGIDAVAVMAHARFTLRAYLLDGKSPAEALEKCSHQFDISVDGHMTTALVGVGDWRTGEISLANAGHPRPLRLTADGPTFVSTPTGPPLGVGPSVYGMTTLTLEPGETFFAFTDGLVERRTEDIDAGMERLSSTIDAAGTGQVDDLVTHALTSMRHQDAPDDIAVLAFRWLGTHARVGQEA